jgi:hypothetical protein
VWLACNSCAGSDLTCGLLERIIESMGATLAELMEQQVVKGPPGAGANANAGELGQHQHQPWGQGAGAEALVPAEAVAVLPSFLGSLDDGVSAIAYYAVVAQGALQVQVNQRFASLFLSKDELLAGIFKEGFTPGYIFARWVGRAARGSRDGGGVGTVLIFPCAAAAWWRRTTGTSSWPRWRSTTLQAMASEAS